MKLLRVSKSQDAAHFTFAPEADEIVGGIDAFWVSGNGELHISVGIERNKKKKDKLQKKHKQLIEAAINMMRVKP